MKVVFSPNLHLSVYPDASAFYCDRATCTLKREVLAERQWDESGLQSKSSSLCIPRYRCFLLRQSHMHETGENINQTFSARSHSILITQTECFLLWQSHMHEQREYTTWSIGSTDHTLSLGALQQQWPSSRGAHPHEDLIFILASTSFRTPRHSSKQDPLGAYQ